jgi:hypothetical protein
MAVAGPVLPEADRRLRLRGYDADGVELPERGGMQARVDLVEAVQDRENPVSRSRSAARSDPPTR